MPFDSTTYLTTQGWEGKGIPLDGVGGAGLKKPIVIPRKDSFKGVGKDRDRAQAWWEDVYATSAKTLKFAVPASSPATPKSAPSTSMPASSSSSSRDGAPSTSTLPLAQANDPTVAGISVVPPKQKMSLQSMAKREHARKMLMSGFVRGKPETVKKEEPIAKETLKAPVEQAITSSSLQPSQPGPSTEVLAESSTSSSSSKVKGKDKESSKTKKRKSSSSKTNETTSSNKSDKKKRRRDGKPDASSSKVDSKKAKRSDKVEAGADGETLIESKEARALRKALRAEEKLSKKRKRKDETESGQTSTTLSSRASMPTHDESSESPSSKEQRRAEKLEKKLRKEARRLKKEAKKESPKQAMG